MELTKTFGGGLNTDDAFEVIDPADYHVAENLISGRSSTAKNGLLESVRGTRAIESAIDIPLVNGDFDDNLNGWTQKIISSVSGSASIAFSVPDATLIAGTIGAMVGSANISFTLPNATLDASAGYSVTVFARSESVASVNQAEVMYKINGGAEVQLGTDFNTIFSGYATIGTIPNVANLSDLEIGVRQASINSDIVFGASDSSSGFYSGFLGLSLPYFVVVENNINVYLRIDLNESGQFREA